MFIIILLLCSGISLITLFKSNNYTKLSIGIFISAVLILFAGTRNADVGRDYLEYSRLFSLYNSIGDINLESFILYEPSILIIPNILKSIFGISYYLDLTFLIFAILGVGLKIKAIARSQFFFLSVLIYCSYFVFGQEMITIRAGVACGLFLLSIKDLENKNDRNFFFKICLAYMFHYSSIIFILIWIIEKLKIKYKPLLFSLLLSFVVAVLKINILTILKLDVFFPKIGAYLSLLEVEGGDPVNVLNFRILFALGFLILFLFKIQLLKENSFFNILFRIHIISLVLFFLLSPTAMVFSLRIFDLLSIVQILLYPYTILLFKERIVGYLILILFCSINFYYIIYISQWFSTGYSSWLV